MSSLLFSRKNIHDIRCPPKIQWNFFKMVLEHLQRPSVCNPTKIFLTSKFNSLLLFFPTPCIKLKMRVQIGKRLLIANHPDQSLWLTNQKQWAAVRCNKSFWLLTLTSKQIFLLCINMVWSAKGTGDPPLVILHAFYKQRVPPFIGHFYLDCRWELF